MYGRNPYGPRGGYVRDSRAGRRYDMDYNYPRRDYDYDYEREVDYAYERPRYDGHYGHSEELDDRTLEHWTHELQEHLEPMHVNKFKMDGVVKKAEEMGVRFDKFTPHEFYATVIMLVSDFGKTLGMTNPDIYARLAKDWLCDEDAGVKYGEKLAAYYHNIVNV